MARFLLVFLICFGVSAGGLSRAAVAASSKGHEASAVAQIVRLAGRDQWVAAQKVAAQSSPLARAIYEWLSLQRSDVELELPRYEAFLKAHPQWPGVRRIRANAERHVASATRPEEVLALYADAKAEATSGRGMVALAAALAARGQGAEAAARLNAWLRNTDPLSEEEDLVVARFGPQIDGATRALMLHRALMRGDAAHARQLAGWMGPAAVRIAEARLALSARAADAEDKYANVPSGAGGDAGLVYERLRWLRRLGRWEEMRAMLLSLPPNFVPIEAGNFWAEQQMLAQQFLDAGDMGAAYQVAALPIHTDRLARAQSMWLSGYIAFAYLKQPGRAFRHFEGLYKSSVSPLTRARAAYWAGRASEGLGYKDVAQAWWRTAAAHRANFYGQLAATLLPAGAKVGQAGPPKITPQDRAVFAASELPRVARLLAKAGQDDRAAAFLLRMADLHAEEGGVVRLAVDAAVEDGLKSTAVKISRQASLQGHDFGDHVFPMLHGMPNSGIEPALMYAIIRQESGFDADIVSPAGAIGLMQLMPRTATHIAKQEREKHRTEWLADRPAHNVRLGTAYLRDLVRQFDGSYALAAAAYNAGPGRVQRWVVQYGDPRQGQIDLVDWIERIPIYETRNYVQRVLEGVAIYREKLGVKLTTAP